MQPPGNAHDAERDRRRGQMLPDLRALVEDVRAGELSASEFRERLRRIHVEHLGEEASSRAVAVERRQAFRAFDALTREAPSRHHELERLAEALGVELDPGTPG